MQANGEDIRVITRNRLNMSKKQGEQIEENIKIKKKVTRKIKYNDTTFSVPQLTFGDKETRMKLKDLLAYKAIQLFTKTKYNG